MLRSAIVTLLLAAPAVSQSKLDPPAAELLKDARAAALEYTVKLPDFLCTEYIQRREDPRGDSRWRPVDKLTVRLAYYDHREDYKLEAVNGKPTTKDYLKVGGSLSTGEFGSRLLSIFHPDSKATFEWKGWSRQHGRRVAVFTYRVDKENSTFQLQYGTTGVGRDVVIAGYRGEVAIDETSHRVLRLTANAEIPINFPIRENTLTLEYDYATVGGQRYLLPVRSETTTRRGSYVAENRVEFKDYRKFHGESSISFTMTDEKPQPDKK